jgi:DNA mismatch repair protein MutS2
MITENALALLEFDRLLAMIAGLTNSDASQKTVIAVRPLKNRVEVEARHGITTEMLRLSSYGEHLPLCSFSDISHLLLRVRPEGSVLEPMELSSFIPVLDMARDIAEKFSEREEFPFLEGFAKRLTGFPDLLGLLGRSIDGDGNIPDSASALLAELRGGMRRLETKIRKKLEDMVRSEAISAFIQDDFITTRSGRWVIPVRMDSKGQVPGVVHDVSKSGETAFIEPLAIINNVNELENLRAEVKAEEIRILRVISSRIRSEADDIGAENEIIVYLDVINAIAKFSARLRMEIPLINEAGHISIIGARHPLLQLAMEKSACGGLPVPLDVRLGEKDTVMVITGSNAGGKTIAIKTIGLLLTMVRCGLPVPADASSDLPLVNNLLIDIGDEQSIENNLSTFSAHVSNISEILKRSDGRTVVLIDELGTGTDPDEGAALACAVLKELKAKGALVFATTHLTDIKGFVHRTEGMINASMEFDDNTPTPLYMLRTGEPGRSHALEIARKYGLPEGIIDTAKALLGGVKVEFDNLIADLNGKRTYYEKALKDIEERMSQIEEKEQCLAAALDEARSREKEILKKAYAEASDILADARRRLNAALDEIKHMDRERTRRAMRDAGQAHIKVSEGLRGLEKDMEGGPLIDEIMEGDTVFVRSMDRDAEVLEVNLKHNRIKVTAGGKEIETQISDIGFKKGKSGKEKSGDVYLHNNSAETVSRINLVGMRVDEALSMLEPFLNHASLDGFSEVVIIHGIGAGILGRAVREHLKGHPLIINWRSGEQSEGGAGVTVAGLR